MKAILLAAGFGTRLRPITNTLPKCLVPIGGKPLLDYWLDMLGQNAIEEIIVNTHYMPETVSQHLQTSQWHSIIFHSHEKEILGTAGTMFQHKDRLIHSDFALIHADNLSFFDWPSFVAAHHARPVDCLITMMTFTTDSPSTCGIVELDERGVVVRFHEKVANPPSNLANGAVYIISSKIFDFLPRSDYSDFSTEILPLMMEKIFTYHNSIYHRDIGNLDSLRQACDDIKMIINC